MATAKHVLMMRLKQARRLYSTSFHAFTAADLAASVRRLGLQAGDTLLVHSAYDAFEGYTDKPSAVIQVLQDAVGPHGAVMMPTLSFTGTAVDYARGNPVFDVRHTPSRTGLLTELFRRSPQVVRSVHPTHSVAVWGQGASALAARHHLTDTPCGEDSPYTRLLDRGGRMLLLGTGIGVLTFYHAVEALLEPKLPRSPFTPERFTLTSRDYEDQIVLTRTRLFCPAISRARNLSRLETELRDRDGWRSVRLGRLDIVMLSAAEVLAAATAMSNRGAYCYDY